MQRWLGEIVTRTCCVRQVLGWDGSLLLAVRVVLKAGLLNSTRTRLQRPRVRLAPLGDGRRLSANRRRSVPALALLARTAREFQLGVIVTKSHLLQARQFIVVASCVYGAQQQLDWGDICQRLLVQSCELVF